MTVWWPCDNHVMTMWWPCYGHVWWPCWSPCDDRVVNHVITMWWPCDDHVMAMLITMCDDHVDHHVMTVWWTMWSACEPFTPQVWLPLYPHSTEHLSFLSKRVMLALPLDMYPQGWFFFFGRKPLFATAVCSVPFLQSSQRLHCYQLYCSSIHLKCARMLMAITGGNTFSVHTVDVL